MAWKKPDKEPPKNFDALLSQKMALEAQMAEQAPQELAALVEKVKSLAATMGVSIKQVFGFRDDAEPKKSRRGQWNGVLYVNPENPEQQYKGRGKRPAWLQEKLDAGASMSDFLMK